MNHLKKLQQDWMLKSTVTLLQGYCQVLDSRLCSTSHLARFAIGRDECCIGCSCGLGTVGYHTLIDLQGMFRLATAIAGVDDGVVGPHLRLGPLHGDGQPCCFDTSTYLKEAEQFRVTRITSKKLD